MSKIDKLIARIKARPVEADFEDVELVLRYCGWEIAHERGSHVSFSKTGEMPIVIPRKHGRKVKQIYLDKLCERLGLDED